jgi:hypothetical protein
MRLEFILLIFGATNNNETKTLILFEKTFQTISDFTAHLPPLKK